MRERLTYNFGLKILSLALAVLVWLVVRLRKQAKPTVM